jgi:hypothetical protein
MNTETLQTALRTWTPPALDCSGITDTGHRACWIVACWETGDGHITVTALTGASTALHDLTGEADVEAVDTGEFAIPTGWLEAATDFGPRMGDLVSSATSYLAGVGLATDERAQPGRRVMRAFVATGEGGALTYERFDSGADGRLRLDIAGPLWWDLDGLLIPLERYRAAVTGTRPHLPAYATTASAAATGPGTSEWPGPR